MENYLPDRIRSYLTGRGLKDETIDAHKISWDGNRIVIPIFDKDGLWLFNKYRRDPESGNGPKYTYDSGAKGALYGIEVMVWSEPTKPIVICEGEFDAMLLQQYGYIAVTSTGGAGTFQKEWVEYFLNRDVYLCFDNDAAGLRGAARITELFMPFAKTVFFPAEIGEKGDITDFFMRLKKTKADFEMILSIAKPLDLPPKKKAPTKKFSGSGKRMQDAKSVPMSHFLKFNNRSFAHCPFHKESTPSFHWIQHSNMWHCFGGCGNGDTIDFVMKRDGVTFGEAITTILKSV